MLLLIAGIESSVMLPSDGDAAELVPADRRSAIHTAPSGPSARASASEVGLRSGNSVITPAVVTPATRAGDRHRVPQVPVWTGHDLVRRLRRVPGRKRAAETPRAVVMRRIRPPTSPSVSVNQSAPSGPVSDGARPAQREGVGYRKLGEGAVGSEPHDAIGAVRAKPEVAVGPAVMPPGKLPLSGSDTP